jgi:hypothetical protein
MILNKPPNPVPAASCFISDAPSSIPSTEVDADICMQTFSHAAAPTPPSFLPLSDPQIDHPPMFDMSTPLYMRELPRPRFEVASFTKSLSSLFEDIMPAPTATRLSSSGQSPTLIDLLLPGSELNARPESVKIPPMIDSELLPQMEMTHDLVFDNDAEETIREPQISDVEMWMS